MDARLRNVFRYVVPAVSSMVVTFAYVVVDGMFVGRGVGANYDSGGGAGKIMAGEGVPFEGLYYADDTAFSAVREGGFHVYLPANREGTACHAFRLSEETRKNLLALQLEEGYPFQRVHHLALGWRFADENGNDLFTDFKEHRFAVFSSPFYPAAFDFAFKLYDDIGNSERQRRIVEENFFLLPGQSLLCIRQGGRLGRYLSRTMGDPRKHFASQALMIYSGDARLNALHGYGAARLNLYSMRYYSPDYGYTDITSYCCYVSGASGTSILDKEPINLRVENRMNVPPEELIPALADGRIQHGGDSRIYLFFHPSFILDEQTEATRTRLEFNMEIPKSIYVRTRLFEFFKVEDLLEVDPKAKINQLYDLRVKSLGKFPRGRVVFTGLPDKNRLGFIRDEIMHSLLSGERFDTFIPKAITAAEPIFEELRKELEKDVGSWFPGEKYAADMVEDIDEFRRILKFYSNLSDSDARRAIRNFHTRLRFTRNLDKWYESAPEARLWPAPPPRPTVLPNSHEVHDSYEVYYLPYPSSMPDDSRPKK